MLKGNRFFFVELQKMIFSWNWWLPIPENFSTYGQKIDDLFWIIFYVTGFFFLLTEVALIWFIFRYRKKDGRKAAFIHGNKWAEIIWTVIPGIILLSMAVYSAGPWASIKLEMPKNNDTVVIEVMARQFAWFARYPGADGKFGATKLELVTGGDPFGRVEDDPAGKDDFVTMNDIYVPVGQKVLFKLQTRDVIHSLFVPNLRIKQDAVPGMVIPVWFEATKAGQYEIACAELCGIGHTMMRGMLNVQTKEEFNKWLSQQVAASHDDTVVAKKFASHTEKEHHQHNDMIQGAGK